MKHERFAYLAIKQFPEISIPQSLTIWSPLEDLKKDIAEFTGIDAKIVSSAIDSITLNSNDAYFLKDYSSKFMPMLINLGNGYALKPISSIIRNPFFSAITLLEQRDSNMRNHISLQREKWFQEHIYAMFYGTRYQAVDGNVKLRKGEVTITDIDGAIYDNLTGELAIIQIKWQDFFFNDVKKLRSKASNLIKELEDWAMKVTDWISENGREKLITSLRLKPAAGKSISSIYLFGLSKNAARMQGYGFDMKSDNLAIATWPQFFRNRFEIGPSERVIHDLFTTLKAQQQGTVPSKPLPLRFEIFNKTMLFEDLWSIADELKETG